MDSNNEQKINMNYENGGDLEETPTVPEEPEISEEPEENKFYYQSISDFYDRVRINLNSSSDILSDVMIDYPENAPMAEMKMKLRVPEWENLDDMKKSLFDLCIIYMTCYSLCPVISNYRSIIEQTTPSLTVKYSSNTNKDKNPCDRFLVLVDDLVSQILEEEIIPFTGFKVTPPTRNVCCCCNPFPRYPFLDR